VSQVADTIIPNLDTGGAYNDLTRGAGAGTSAGASSFRTTGFQNNGIDTANTDYFQVFLSAANGYGLSLSSITAVFAGTTSFSANHGVEMQWAYSFDGGVNLTLIGSSQFRIGNGSVTWDLSGTPALQGIAAGTDVTLRMYASGQTTTGGWGYIGDSGLQVYGTVIPEPSVLGLMLLGGLGVMRFARRRHA